MIVVGTDKNIINDYSEDIVTLCKSNGINWCYHEKFDYRTIGEITIAVSWNRMIETKHTQLIVLHESLLPKYRGFAPLVNQLLNKEPQVGVTAFYATNEYDKGDIIFQERIPISYPLKIKDAIKIVSEYYQKISLKILHTINNGKEFETIQQNEKEATYSLWRDYDDYFINWSNESTYISRFIDSVGEPYLGAQTYMNDEQITVLESAIVNDLVIENRDCGKVIFFEDNFPVVVCGKGLLKITCAVNNLTGESIFPLKKFRIRFKSKMD